jgi:CelD/BcsL family acetyltransferase involved in cellulose biosynthesis
MTASDASAGVERLELITEASRLAALAGPWQELADGAPTPFSDHGWFMCWWEAFAPAGQLATLVVWRGEQLSGALPLHRQGRRLVALANYHTPVFAPLAVDPEAAAALIGAALDRRPSELLLTALPAEDLTRELLRRGSRARRRILLDDAAHVSPIVDTSGDHAEYERERRSTLRTLMRRRRKLYREREAVFTVDEAPRVLDAALSAGFAVEASGWKTHNRSAIVSAPETEAFYRAIAHEYAARGELRLVWLHVDGQPAAFSFCLERRRRLFLLKTGFDEALATYTPGLVQQLELIDWCFATGREAYELLGDAESWKRQFATSEREHVRLWSYRPRPVPLARYAARRYGAPLLRRYRARADGD